MTFSLAGRCAKTGMVGAIVTTSSIAVGSRCPHVAAGIGAEDPTAGLGALGAFGDAGNFSNQGGVLTVFALKNPWAPGK